MKKWIKNNIHVFFACILTVAIIIFGLARVEGFGDVFNPRSLMVFTFLLTVGLYGGKNKKL